MNISEAGLELIKRHEGMRLIAYQDSVGIWTVGYGHTGSDVGPGVTISKEEAAELLREDIGEAEACIEEHVMVDLTQGQYDALCSFVFNLGCGAFMRSTLLRMLNESDYDGAAQQFLRWVNAGGQKLPGLVKRRADEMALFTGESGPTYA